MTTDTASLFKPISGHFFRSVLLERQDQVLDPPDSSSAGRYHRPGQPALYTSPTMEWAIIAVSGYMREDGRRRVVVPLIIGEAWVLDQHDEQACKQLGIDRDQSNESWRSALAANRQPACWRSSDAARLAGADGIIDRSRMISGGWHLNLFRWNELGGPSVKVCGEPIEITLSGDDVKWGL
jgi:RES domain-containing protein